MSSSNVIYYRVFGALLALLALTVIAAYLPLGPRLGPVVNLTIAVTKAALILIFFMHLKYSGKLVAVFAVSGFYWLLILISLTLTDYWTRDWIPMPGK